MRRNVAPPAAEVVFIDEVDKRTAASPAMKALDEQIPALATVTAAG